MLERVKLKIYDVLVDTSDDDVVDKAVAAGLMVLIVLNVVAVILETVESINAEYGPFLVAFETFSVAVFTVEYIFRLWIAPLDVRYARPVWGRVKYALTPMALIDLIAILPAILPIFIATDLRIIRALRVMRIFRLLKMPRYVQSLTTLDKVLRSKKEELIVTTTMIAIMLIFAGSLMYLIENEAQPDKFPDIPSALWWGIATLTTVGYGDVFPVTPMGRLLGGIIAFLGIGIFALPTGILANGFAEHIRRQGEKECVECPHCGESLEKD